MVLNERLPTLQQEGDQPLPHRLRDFLHPLDQHNVAPGSSFRPSNPRRHDMYSQVVERANKMLNELSSQAQDEEV